MKSLKTLSKLIATRTFSVNIKTDAMNSDQIDSSLHARCRRQFVGVFPADRLPVRLPAKRPLRFDNTNRHNQPGKHWIAIYLGRNSRGAYFDSFGQPPPPMFLRYLNSLSTSWTTNNRQLQSAASRFSGNIVFSFVSILV